jgi:hypothetical protein
MQKLAIATSMLLSLITSVSLLADTPTSPPNNSTQSSSLPAPVLTSGQTADYDNYAVLLYGKNFDSNCYIDVRSTTGSDIIYTVQSPYITYLPGSVSDVLSFRINDPTLQNLLSTQGLRFYVGSPDAGYQWAGPITLQRTAAYASQPPAFHSVYFQPYHGSLWAALADDTGAPSPRQEMVWSINNELQAIHASGLDTITVPLPNNDSWWSQHGGAFSYDPVNHPTGQYAVAQEILLRIAAANGLKVIFVIQPTPYQESSDGRAAWNGLADQYDVTPSSNGSLDYIHSVIDPLSYYGPLNTTQLSTIGLTDGPIGSYNIDPRVAGFIFAPELNPAVVSPGSGIQTNQRYFNKYWNWFYNLVHWNGSQSAFAGIYIIGSPSSSGGVPAQIKALKNFKSWFAPGGGNAMPDYVGIEAYGGTGYPLQNMAADMNVTLNAMIGADTIDYPGDFAIPSQKIFIAEANTDEQANPYTNQYYQYMQQFINKRAMGGIEWFASDSWGDGTPASVVDPNVSLYQVQFTPVGTKLFDSTLPSGISWHNPVPTTDYGDPTTYGAYTARYSTQWGTLAYTSPTARGYWYGEGIANFEHGHNVVAYLYPNPMIGDSSHLAVTTIYWDASEMTGVTNVEIHMSSPGGPLFAGGSAVGNATTGDWVTDGAVFYVQDVSGGKALTSANTLATIHANVQQQ